MYIYIYIIFFFKFNPPTSQLTLLKLLLLLLLLLLHCCWDFTTQVLHPKTPPHPAIQPLRHMVSLRYRQMFILVQLLSTHSMNTKQECYGKPFFNVLISKHEWPAITLPVPDPNGRFHGQKFSHGKHGFKIGQRGRKPHPLPLEPSPDWGKSIPSLVNLYSPRLPVRGCHLHPILQLCQPLLLSLSWPTPFFTRFLRVLRSFWSYSTCRLLYRGILEVEAGDCRHLPIWQLNLILMGIRVAQNPNFNPSPNRKLF